MPLATFTRGRYTIEAIATDRVGGRQTTHGHVRVIGTPAACWAPRRARRSGAACLRQPLAALGRALAPPSPSGRWRALAAVEAGRFADLLAWTTRSPRAAAGLGAPRIGLTGSATRRGPSPRSSAGGESRRAVSASPPDARRHLRARRRRQAAVTAWNQAREGRHRRRRRRHAAHRRLHAAGRRGPRRDGTAALDSQPGNAPPQGGARRHAIATRRPWMPCVCSTRRRPSRPEHDPRDARFAGVVASDTAMTAPPPAISAPSGSATCGRGPAHRPRARVAGRGSAVGAAELFFFAGVVGGGGTEGVPGVLSEYARRDIRRCRASAPSSMRRTFARQIRDSTTVTEMY
jgi:hypothetical protein